ncbi:MAG: nitrate/sulfonate/bicarbonate ABC transporter ATP-binding protein [Desulfuromonas sp.]|nr:MAG: nitrate/sulfonate/bicarbonate ABC transporter ATP-binding protein [Desulfuromonas sp.]
MLQFDQVSFSYPDGPVLDRVHFRVERGAYEGIIGPSGCGKSTLMRLISGLLQTADGTIERGFERLGLVCQEDTLIDEISILRNITYVCNDPQTARRCLQLVGLGELPEKTRAATLSKGMKKRVEIARALSINPDFLVMDEPFSGLDHVGKFALIAQLKHFLAAIDTTFLYVTHDISEALLVCDHLTVLSARPARVLRRFENVQQADRQQLKQAIIQLLGHASCV